MLFAVVTVIIAIISVVWAYASYRSMHQPHAGVKRVKEELKRGKVLYQADRSQRKP